MKNYPKRYAILFADDIRYEQGNKTSLMGIYGDRLQIEDGPPSDNPDAVPVIPTFGIYAVMYGAEGEFQTTIELTAPSGQVVAQTSIAPVTVMVDAPLVIAVKVSNIPLAEQGLYTATVHLDDHEYKQTIAVVRNGSRV